MKRLGGDRLVRLVGLGAEPSAVASHVFWGMDARSPLVMSFVAFCSHMAAQVMQ